MKRLLTFATTIFLGASLALAQTGGDKKDLNPQPLPPGRHPADNTKPNTKTTEKGGKKGHKSSKPKSKKTGSPNSNTQTPQ